MSKKIKISSNSSKKGKPQIHTIKNLKLLYRYVPHELRGKYKDGLQVGVEDRGYHFFDF